LGLRDILFKRYGPVEVHKADNKFAATNIRDHLKAEGYGSVKIKEVKSYLVSGRRPLKRGKK